jgi:hypothetical protein
LYTQTVIYLWLMCTLLLIVLANNLAAKNCCDHYTFKRYTQMYAKSQSHYYLVLANNLAADHHTFKRYTQMYANLCVNGIRPY